MQNENSFCENHCLMWNIRLLLYSLYGFGLLGFFPPTDGLYGNMVRP